MLMVDLRERVEEDRGLLKRIQLAIPGFRGYRQREDLRQADSLLRIQLADRLKAVRGQVESARQTLAEGAHLKALEPVGRVVLECQELEGMIRHAEQGYSGISPAIRVEERELNLLYEFDLALLEGLDALRRKAEGIPTAGDPASAAREFSAALRDLKATFQRRWGVITGTEVR